MGELLNTPVTAAFGEALRYASELHARQARKQTQIPYISHLMTVAALVFESGGSETAAIGALLHDAAEDQGGEATLTTIREKFGPEVEEIVRHCSDDVVAEGQTKRPWRIRKAEYIARLAETDATHDALLVSLADKLHNCMAIVTDITLHGPSVWDRFNGQPEDIAWYYEEILLIARQKLPNNRLTRQLELWVPQLASAAV